MYDISKNLKRIRTSKGWTQQQMADALFVTRQAVSNWETGKNMPDLNMLQTMAEKLGVTAEEILYGKKPVLPEVKKDYSKLKKQFILSLVLYAISVLMMLSTITYDFKVDVFLVGCCIYIAAASPILFFTAGNFIFQYYKYHEKIGKPLPFRRIIRCAIIGLCCFQLVFVILFGLEPVFYYRYSGISIIPDKIAGLFQLWAELNIFVGGVIFFIAGFLYEWTAFKE